MKNLYSDTLFLVLCMIVLYSVIPSSQGNSGPVMRVVDISHTLKMYSDRDIRGLQEDYDTVGRVAYPNAPQGDLDCLIEAVYFESKGEADVGKRLVAQSILNRVKSKKFPDTVCGVVKQRVRGVYQYSYLYRKNLTIDKKSKAYKTIVVIATEALSGKYKNLLSNKYYKRCDYESSFFRNKLEHNFKSGNHCFYSEKENV